MGEKVPDLRHDTQESSVSVFLLLVTRGCTPAPWESVFKAPAEPIHLLSHPQAGSWNAEVPPPCLQSQDSQGQWAPTWRPNWGFFPALTCPPFLQTPTNSGTSGGCGVHRHAHLASPCRVDCYLPLNQSTASNYISFDFDKLAFVKQSSFVGCWAHSSTKRQGNWNRQVSSPHGSWRKHSTPGRATWKGQGRMHQRRAGPGHMPLLGSMGAVLWGSQAKPRLVNSNEKQQGFGKLCRDLSRGYTT